MKNKGLCVTCNYDVTCCFPRRFPVLECEEFDVGKSASKVKKAKVPDCCSRGESCASIKEEAEIE